MKSFRILSIFLAFILVTPVITSYLPVDGTIDNFEITEKSSEKEQREKRESDTKYELEEIEKFLLLHKSNPVLLSNAKSKFMSKRIEFSDFNTDVLTPPPEFI